MNLHAIVSGAIGAINPPIPCTLKISTGYTISPDATQQPTYDYFQNVPAQIQALSGSDIHRMGGLNTQSTQRAVYFYGSIEGLDRQAGKGGDLLIVPPMPGFPRETTWLVTQVLEYWPGWSKCVLTLQNDGGATNGRN